MSEQWPDWPHDEVVALRGRVAQLEKERDEARAVIGRYVPLHDSPFRPLLDSEIEKLRGLCESRRYLFWWDMGSAIATIDAEKQRAALTERATVEAIASWLEEAGTDESVGYASDLLSGDWKQP